MYQKIMIPLDGSKLAECVFPHVAALAGGGRVESIALVRVVEPLYQAATADFYLSSDEIAKANEDTRIVAENYLRQLTQNVRFNGAIVKTELLTGRAADVLADYAIRNGMDLIVIATHGRSGVSRWVWGSVADRILRSACVPVLMVRAPGCVPGI
jgi:nucleotide-binding universal stress UspA family protein